MADIYYQDLLTTPKDILEWSLIHSTRNQETSPEVQSMAVVIGMPEAIPTKVENVITETQIETTITDGIKELTKVKYEAQGITSNNQYGYAVNSELAALSQTKGSGWEEAKGIYIVPENQKTTRFGFLPTIQLAGGNFLDNVKITTLLGNVKCQYNSNTDMYEITGYWEPSSEKNANKDLVYHIKNSSGNEILTGKIEMSNITTNHFKVEFKKFMNEEITVDVYHEDYQY